MESGNLQGFNFLGSLAFWGFFMVEGFSFLTVACLLSLVFQKLF